MLRLVLDLYPEMEICVHYFPRSFPDRYFLLACKKICILLLYTTAHRMNEERSKLG